MRRDFRPFGTEKSIRGIPTVVLAGKKSSSGANDYFRGMIRLLLFFACMLSAQHAFSQGNPPWKQPLMMAHAPDGIHFLPPEIFQDSAGVPSLVRWKGDTLACAFQWFRLPQFGPSWDRVAIKFSYDNGKTWTGPAPIQVNGFVGALQRPFDPTLAPLPDGRLRIYFSSSEGNPPPALDASVNTYSAVSNNGIQYQVEAGARVDHPTNRVIDPAVVFFNNNWHYVAPVGTPQQGAYHYISQDGLTFSQVVNIGSDQQHNWTGNFMLASGQELRFYGCGPGKIWYCSSPNGGAWSGYVATNLTGGDPTVVKLAQNDYLMIYVGQPYTTPVAEAPADDKIFDIYPNPANPGIFISCRNKPTSEAAYRLYSPQGQLLQAGSFWSDIDLDLRGVNAPFVLLTIFAEGKLYAEKVFITR